MVSLRWLVCLNSLIVCKYLLVWRFSFLFRSSRSQMFLKIGVPWRPVTLWKKRLQYSCFPVKFAKFLRTRFFLQNTFGGCLSFSIWTRCNRDLITGYPRSMKDFNADYLKFYISLTLLFVEKWLTKHTSKMGINGTKYSRIDQVKLGKTAFKNLNGYSRPYPFKFFKGCLPQISLGPFLNTLSQIWFTSIFYEKLLT